MTITVKWIGQRGLNSQSKADENGITLILELPDIIKKYYLECFLCRNK